MKRRNKKNQVKCSICGKTVGYDSAARVIDSCYTCTNKKDNEKRVDVTAATAFARTKKGPAKDLPPPYNSITFRSGWERNFARFLCAQGKSWEYEKLVFTFRENKDGKPYKTRPFIYIPDFHDLETGTLWEVKGYLQSQDRSKMRRMKAHYPEDLKRVKACCSRNNKKAIEFYKEMGIPMIFIEDIKDGWKQKIPGWE